MTDNRTPAEVIEATLKEHLRSKPVLTAPGRPYPDWDMAVAGIVEAIVDGLGLTQEWSDDIAGPDWQRYSRWVTETTAHPGPSRLAAGLS